MATATKPEPTKDRLKKAKENAAVTFWAMVAAERTGKPADPRKLLEVLFALGKTAEDFDRAVLLLERRARHREMVAKEAAIETKLHEVQAEIGDLGAELERVKRAIEQRGAEAENRRRRLEGYLGEVMRARDALLHADAIPELHQARAALHQEALPLGTRINRLRDAIREQERDLQINPRDHGKDEGSMAARKRSAEIGLPLKRQELADLEPDLAGMEAELNRIEKLLLET